MFRIEFETDGEAFDDESGALYPEVCGILRGIARRVEDDGIVSGLVRDSKGNKIGRWGFLDNAAGPSKTPTSSVSLED